mmetsp:Transcript_83990/g.102889  ORF Transcript_83990/g.102889 Transcript_83990/m.102889 type:complete len:81 (+) Transcript_83990:56-298(+)
MLTEGKGFAIEWLNAFEYRYDISSFGLLIFSIAILLCFGVLFRCIYHCCTANKKEKIKYTRIDNNNSASTSITSEASSAV